jgi:hypothetical protein
VRTRCCGVANQIARRNLTPSQRAALAIEFEKELPKEASAPKRLSREKVEKILPSQKGKASEKAAEMYGVNPHYVTDAKQIKVEVPEVFELMKQGITVRLPLPCPLYSLHRNLTRTATTTTTQGPESGRRIC